MVESSEPNERDESERSCAAESIECGLACNRIDLVSASKDIAAHVLKKHFKASTILSPRDRTRLLSRRHRRFLDSDEQRMHARMLTVVNITHLKFSLEQQAEFLA